LSIEAKLEAVRNRTAEYGRLYGAKETADDYLKVTYATLYADAEGQTVTDRDSWVRRHEEYQEAIKRKQNAYADFKESETYLKLLFAEVEVYRTECANDRAVDRAHR
jgi:hypothetical protein